ncbi:MAG: phage tail protein [Ilumatobacteraceae bacterium]
MSEPFLAEVRIVAFNFAPRGWAFCDGQILPINQNQSLYSLLGTTFGGDGRTSFALPDLRGRTAIHFGSSNGTNHTIGQKSGEETVTLSAAEMPQHTHGFQASANTANQAVPTGNVPATPSSSLGTVYSGTATTQNTTLNPASIANTGGGQAHNNMQPYLAVNFCIALQGLFPSRN